MEASTFSDEKLAAAADILSQLTTESTKPTTKKRPAKKKSTPATKKEESLAGGTVDEPLISLRRLEVMRVEVPIIGTTPVIPNKFSAKAKRMMAEKQQGTKVQTKLPPKNPENDAEEATYYLQRTAKGKKLPSIKADNFKGAIVGAVRLFQGLTMTQAKVIIYVEGEIGVDGGDPLIPLTFGERLLREDAVRNANNVADLRYRYSYWPWSCNIVVRFIPTVIDFQSIVTLIDAAGMAGVGDWRPSAPRCNTGTFGQFKVDTSQEIHVLPYQENG